MADYDRLKHPVFRFHPDQLFDVGQRICDKLLERLQLRLLALTVQTWHIHYVAPATTIPLSTVVKETKESVRFFLKPSQPLWTVDFDRRYCYDWERLRERVLYVEEHNVRQGWSRQPWSQLMNWDEYVRSMIG